MSPCPASIPLCRAVTVTTPREDEAVTGRSVLALMAAAMLVAVVVLDSEAATATVTWTPAT
jgi:hypothetical protein